MMIIQRGRHANNDGIHLCNTRIISGRRNPAFLRCLNVCFRNTNDVRSAPTEDSYLLLVNVKARNPEFLFAEQQNERKTYVAEADHSDSGRSVFDLAFE